MRSDVGWLGSPTDSDNTVNTNVRDCLGILGDTVKKMKFVLLLLPVLLRLLESCYSLRGIFIFPLRTPTSTNCFNLF